MIRLGFGNLLAPKTLVQSLNSMPPLAASSLKMKALGGARGSNPSHGSGGGSRGSPISDGKGGQHNEEVLKGPTRNSRNSE
ncbi:hypothetical protein Fmac_018902 [Flemingia macrophylla]|uniref:Uncharacterized protein n=1 Tax=Flemingia macrophylla TaxID=520843 RepID=A0ABD1M6F6_9FABA